MSLFLSLFLSFFFFFFFQTVIITPNISNIASSSLDLKWLPPSNYWDAITVTGYSIKIMRQDNIPCYLAASRALQEKDVQYPDVYYVELGNVSLFFLIIIFFSYFFFFIFFLNH